MSATILPIFRWKNLLDGENSGFAIFSSEVFVEEGEGQGEGRVLQLEEFLTAGFIVLQLCMEK